MLTKVLIANRGDIALRIVCACRELGLRTCVAHSQPDSDSLAVRFADEAVCIGPAASEQSYLSIPAILTAAAITGADALHPGYGFLSESASLAEACQAAGVVFIGPPPQVLHLLGDKARARRVMQAAGLQVVPGTESFDDPGEGARLAEALGFPVLIKATSGGGGRGLRVVRTARDLAPALGVARHEAVAAFGDPRLYLERYVDGARHIEFQVLADETRAVQLGDRECTLQRRHQKVLEEAPAVGLSETARRTLGDLVVKAALEIGYRNAGTFEFLVDSDGEPYFIEANARIQVEHPVTEMVTGVDLVKEQVRVAAGDGLSVRQADVQVTGHAIECRVNAEHPDTGRPAPGMIRAFSAPGGPGVRVDSYAHADCMVWPHYDALVAKVITHGRDRAEATARMRRALEMMVVEGVETTIPLHLRVLSDPDFLAGRFTTSFLERFLRPV
ncbi:MAG: acetyl-CoA carboxylase biotin carboxylase subunit [Acidobacteriota bacterium]|nr:acetyl-CoA carboxylase biotin carboxylase subunit [Acidobacteriota bacterium]